MKKSSRPGRPLLAALALAALLALAVSGCADGRGPQVRAKGQWEGGASTQRSF